MCVYYIDSWAKRTDFIEKSITFIDNNQYYVYSNLNLEWEHKKYKHKTVTDMVVSLMFNKNVELYMLIC